jgi:IclR family KDG regulon transcriptional repressor
MRTGTRGPDIVLGMPVNDSAADSIYRVQVIDRVFQILDLLAENKGDLGATELAQRLELHKSTVHRLLVTLEQHRFLQKNPENAKYRLGWRLFELGALAVSRVELHSMARPHLDALVRKTGETAHVGVVTGGELISIASVEADRNLRLPGTVGRRSPLYCTSQGKSILAFSVEAVAAETIRSIQFKRYTQNTITTAARLKQELERVRKCGYAVDNEEFENDLRCIGAPVFNHEGQVVAAISIAAPTYRVGGREIPRLAAVVITASKELSAALGYSSQLREGKARLSGASRMVRRNLRQPETKDPT